MGLLYAAELPFHDWPAAVGSTADQINHLPCFPAIVRDEDFVRLRVDTKLPRISETVAKDFWPGVGRVDKWIVLWDRILLSGGRVIDIDSQNGAEQICHVLACC